MIQRTLTYTDYNGETRTENFYFNLTAAEITRLNFQKKGGLKGIIEKIIKTDDTGRMFALFEEIIQLAYGERSEDGRQFVKSRELSRAFSQTPAYSDLIIGFITDPDMATDFLNELIPADLANGADREKAAEEVKKLADAVPDVSLR